MLAKRRLFIVFLVLLGAVVVARIVSAQEPERDILPSELIAILGADQDAAVLGETRLNMLEPSSIRDLGLRDGVSYFAGLVRNEPKICLVARRGKVEEKEDPWNFEAAGCIEIPAFAKQGQVLAVNAPGTPVVVAYLLPDGYSSAAGSITWAEVIGENLLVVTDLAGAPAGEVITLNADDSTKRSLSLSILSFD